MAANPVDRIAFVLARNQVFTKFRDILATSALFAWGGMLLLSAVVAFMAFKLADRPREYFAIDETGAVVQILPLSVPTISQEALMNFTVEGVTRSFTYNPLAWRQNRQDASRFFTRPGWDAFSKELDKIGPNGQKVGLQALIENNVMTTAVPAAAPVVTEIGMAVEGIWRITVQFPMIVTYQSAGAPSTETLLVTAVVSRRSQTEHPLGIGIASLTTRAFGGNNR